MISEIRRSKLLGRSQLVGGFKQTAGFGMIVRKNGIEQMREQFPELWPFLQFIIRENPSRLVQSSWRSIFQPPSINAFYINVLSMRHHHGVTRHVDATLQPENISQKTIPRAVSVLYLSSPKNAGGNLRIFVNQILHSEVTPEPGLVVHFRGNLSHEITAVENTSHERLSLVCEQYVLPQKILGQLPPFQIQSRALDPIFDRAASELSFKDRLRSKPNPQD